MLVERIVPLGFVCSLDGFDGELAEHVKVGEQLLILSDDAGRFGEANSSVEVDSQAAEDLAVPAGLCEPNDGLAAGQGTSAGFGGEIALVDQQSGAVRLSPHYEVIAAKGQVGGFRGGALLGGFVDCLGFRGSAGFGRPRQDEHADSQNQRDVPEKVHNYGL